MKIAVLLSAVVCAALLACGQAGAQSAPATSSRSAEPAAIKFLSQALAAPRQAEDALMGLRLTLDPDLLPLFEAVARSDKPARRLFAVEALRQIGSPATSAPLLASARRDTAVAIRRSALAALLDSGHFRADDLAPLLSDPDANIRCLAASGMAKLGQVEAARQAVAQLAQDKDQRVALMARSVLLSAGDTTALDALKAAICDKATSDDMALLVVQMACERKLPCAPELAMALAASKREPPIRASAYELWSGVQPAAAAAEAAKAIAASDSTMFRVSLLRVVAGAKAAEQLAAIAKGDDAVAALAKLELARAGEAKDLSAAATEALKAGHPIVVSYVWRCALADAARGAGAYSPPLMDYIKHTEPDALRMQRDHMYAAEAAAALIELGDEATIAEMERILRGEFSALQRVIGTGVLRARPTASSRRLAAVAVKSQYQEMFINGALALGQAADASAREHLLSIVGEPTRYSVPLAAQAAWHLVRIDGAGAVAARELAGAYRD